MNIKAIATAVVSAVVIVALLVTCQCSNDKTSNHFGNESLVYTLSGSTSITDCTGDTELLCANSFKWISTPNEDIVDIEVNFTNNLGTVALTSELFVNGKNIDTEGKSESCGYVELLQGKKWEKVGDLVVVSGVGHMLGGTPPYPRLTGNSAHIAFCPSGAGTYRLTYYFREDVNHRNYEYETGGKLYSISHSIEVPKSKGMSFSVDSVKLSLSSRNDTDDCYAANVTPTIKINCGTIYLNKQYTQILKKKGGSWINVSSTDSGNYHLVTDSDSMCVGPNPYLPNMLSTIISMILRDYAGEYKLVLFFTENEDGSGERYMLTLNLRFDE